MRHKLENDPRSFRQRVRDGKAACNGLLGTNPKVEKGRKRGYATYILHLAPSDLSGYQTCPFATAGCRAACLNTAGRGGVFTRPDGCDNLAEYVKANLGETNNVQAARVRRTHLYFEDRPAFMALLANEIRLAIGRAERDGLTPVFRLNGTSDITWERQAAYGPYGEVFPNIFEAFPTVTFYDYTKNPHRDVSAIPNYSLTFSLAESNLEQAREAFRNGINVAVVFRANARKHEPLPDEWSGLTGEPVPVFDADQTDLRFLDPEGVILGLRAKGEALTDDTGFVKELPTHN